jgi:hypothetical protein
MKTMRTVLASPRLTLAGFALLALMVWATSADARVSSSWIALPSAVLAANLGATMVVHRALRRGGLGLFHAALLVGMLVVALGRMLHFEGRVEVTQGGELAAEAIEPLSIGPWNNHAWRGVRFEQGPIRVHYAAGVRQCCSCFQSNSGYDGRCTTPLACAARRRSARCWYRRMAPRRLRNRSATPRHW